MGSRTPARLLPKPRLRRLTVPQLPAEHCPNCQRQLNDAKYHDCGEQNELFDATPYRRPGKRRR